MSRGLLSRKNHAPFLMKVATAICLFSVFFNPIMKIALAGDLPAEVTVRLLGPDNTPFHPKKCQASENPTRNGSSSSGRSDFTSSVPRGRSSPSVARSWITRRRVFTFVRAVICLYSAQRQSSIPARAGPAFSSPLRGKMSLRSRIGVMACFARKFAVPVAEDISDTSFLTVRHRPGSDTV